MTGYQEIPHTAGCLEHRARIQDAFERLEQWHLAWPNACRVCEGSGVVMVDSGDPSVGLPPYYDFCEKCLLAGICPRCGRSHGCTVPDEEERSVDFPFLCVQCGVTNKADQVSGQTIRDEVLGVPDCICEEERYATWRALNPPTRHEEALNMGMTDKEAAEYSRTGELPDSYLRRADEAYDAWRERRSFNRF